MTKPVGTQEVMLDGQPRLWVRCPQCGDSAKRPWIAHAVVDLAGGTFHCFRCGTSATLSNWVPTFSTVIDSHEGFTVRSLPKPQEGPGSGRPSAMPRWHWGEDDIFFSSSGAFLRITPDGRRTAHGPLRQGLGLGRWVSPALNTSSDRPLIVVEGPYDVRDGFTDVCLFGLVPTRAQLRLLEGCFIVLRPDGDVWTKPLLKAQFLKKWRYARSIILGVDILPGEMDPDDLSSLEGVDRVSLESL